MASSYFERPQEEEDTFEDHIDGQVLLTMADVKHCHSRHLSSPLQSMSTGETNPRPRVLYHPIQSITPTCHVQNLESIGDDVYLFSSLASIRTSFELAFGMGLKCTLEKFGAKSQGFSCKTKLAKRSKVAIGAHDFFSPDLNPDDEARFDGDMTAAMKLSTTETVRRVQILNDKRAANGLTMTCLQQLERTKLAKRSKVAIGAHDFFSPDLNPDDEARFDGDMTAAMKLSTTETVRRVQILNDKRAANGLTMTCLQQLER
ncbi:hypothetical protein F2Q69_00014294 [Brassica cretica]|uniref:Uncharacterized protein n=1 Tax=Brassica cretica TaxID=69181 RepID=A0A8S9R8U7_BRACR|nr:hypothetical protein F2Q69_00014294 [Brassica cretica]